MKESIWSNESYSVATTNPWRHQGSDTWLQFRVYEKLLPGWATGIIIVLLLFFSALFSGLTLGLMSMDKTDLKILCTTGTVDEQKYAATIIPVRSHGSLLLCSLLLGNVLVNSVLTILMDDLTSGLIAVIFSTLAIVIFGEIMPQAICSRHGLAVGAKTIYITKFVILLTFLVAYPISKILDYMLGEEIGNVYNRERLKELVKVGRNINGIPISLFFTYDRFIYELVKIGSCSGSRSWHHVKKYNLATFRNEFYLERVFIFDKLILISGDFTCSVNLTMRNRLG